MNKAVAQLEAAAKQVPSVALVPNPAQPAPAPDKPYVVSLRLDFNNTGAVDVARQLRQKIGVQGDQPGQTANGRVRLYVIGQGALGAAAQTTTKHDIAEAERWNLPIVLIVLLAVFGSLAAAAIRWRWPSSPWWSPWVWSTPCPRSRRCRCSSPRRCRCSASPWRWTIRCSS